MTDSANLGQQVTLLDLKAATHFEVRLHPIGR